MLISLSKEMDGSPEGVEMNVSLVSEITEQEIESPWFGNPFRLRAILRDGTQVSLALNMTECVEIYNLLHNDKHVRDWAEMLEFRLGSSTAKDTGNTH